MPIYEFRCEDCGEEFETLLKSRSETETVNCKSCGSPRVKRLMSTITPMVDSGGDGGTNKPRVVETHKCGTGTCTHLELPGHRR